MLRRASGVETEPIRLRREGETTVYKGRVAQVLSNTNLTSTSTTAIKTFGCLIAFKVEVVVANMEQNSMPGA